MSYWMIERVGPQGAEWWDGHSMLAPEFTDDPKRGIKFVSFGDGEIIRCYFEEGCVGRPAGLSRFCRVTEHQNVEEPPR